MAKAKRIRNRIKRLYGSSDIDWMGFSLTEENHSTRHHIKKREYCYPNSDNTIDNSAILGKISHELLHTLELYEKDLYVMWSNLFFEIVDSKKMTEELMYKIHELRRTTEYFVLSNDDIPQQLVYRYRKIFKYDDPALMYLDNDDEYQYIYIQSVTDDMKRLLLKRKGTCLRKMQKKE